MNNIFLKKTGAGAFELDELSDVDTSGIGNNKVLKYNSTSENWEVSDDEHTTYTAGTGLDLSGTEFSTNDSEIDHNSLNNYTIEQHRIINDSSTSSTELWSSNKINTEVGDKADSSDLDDYVPYTGADQDVDLGSNDLTITDTLFVDSDNNRVGIGTTNPSGKLAIGEDNAKLTLGAGEDASIYYDGSDMVFDSQEVGSGNFYFKNGNIKMVGGDKYYTDQASLKFYTNTNTFGFRILGAWSTGWADDVDSAFFQLSAEDRKSAFFTAENGNRFNRFGIVSNGTTISNNSYVGLAAPTAVLHIENISNTKDVLNLTGADAQTSDYMNITSYEGTTGDIFNINSDGDISLPNDNQKILLGAGKDAGIWYDGSNLHIDAQLAGSGTIILDNLPTSDPGIDGGIYNDSGTLKISENN